MVRQMSCQQGASMVQGQAWVPQWLSATCDEQPQVGIGVCTWTDQIQEGNHGYIYVEIRNTLETYGQPLDPRINEQDPNPSCEIESEESPWYAEQKQDYPQL